MSISIVFPAYNEEENIIPLLEAVIPVVSTLTKDFEIIFVDDGSTDNTPYILKQLSKYNYIKVFTHKKNMGKATALYVGFQKATKDIIVTMDSDLQDDPKDMVALIEQINEGYDFVNGAKDRKHKGSVREIPSMIYNGMTRAITGTNFKDMNCPFKAYKASVAKDLSLYGGMHRYIPAQVANMGYSYTEVPVKNLPRLHGETKYGSIRIFRGLMDLVTIKFLMNYKNRPLHIFGTLGLFFGCLGLLIDLYLYIIWVLGQGIGDRPLLMLGVLLTVIGLQFITFGLIAELITSTITRNVDDLIR